MAYQIHARIQEGGHTSYRLSTLFDVYYRMIKIFE